MSTSDRESMDCLHTKDCFHKKTYNLDATAKGADKGLININHKNHRKSPEPHKMS